MKPTNLPGRSSSSIIKSKYIHISSPNSSAPGLSRPTPSTRQAPSSFKWFMAAFYRTRRSRWGKKETPVRQVVREAGVPRFSYGRKADGGSGKQISGTDTTRFSISPHLRSCLVVARSSWGQEFVSRRWCQLACQQVGCRWCWRVNRSGAAWCRVNRSGAVGAQLACGRVPAGVSTGRGGRLVPAGVSTGRVPLVPAGVSTGRVPLVPAGVSTGRVAVGAQLRCQQVGCRWWASWRVQQVGCRWWPLRVNRSGAGWCQLACQQVGAVGASWRSTSGAVVPAGVSTGRVPLVPAGVSTGRVPLVPAGVSTGRVPLVPAGVSTGFGWPVGASLACQQVGCRGASCVSTVGCRWCQLACQQVGCRWCQLACPNRSGAVWWPQLACQQVGAVVASWRVNRFRVPFGAKLAGCPTNRSGARWCQAGVSTGFGVAVGGPGCVSTGIRGAVVPAGRVNKGGCRLVPSWRVNRSGVPFGASWRVKKVGCRWCQLGVSNRSGCRLAAGVSTRSGAVGASWRVNRSGAVGASWRVNRSGASCARLAVSTGRVPLVPSWRVNRGRVPFGASWRVTTGCRLVPRACQQVVRLVAAGVSTRSGAVGASLACSHRSVAVVPAGVVNRSGCRLVPAGVSIRFGCRWWPSWRVNRSGAVGASWRQKGQQVRVPLVPAACQQVGCRGASWRVNRSGAVGATWRVQQVGCRLVPGLACQQVGCPLVPAGVVNRSVPLVQLACQTGRVPLVPALAWSNRSGAVGASWRVNRSGAVGASWRVNRSGAVGASWRVKQVGLPLRASWRCPTGRVPLVPAWRVTGRCRWCQLASSTGRVPLVPAGVSQVGCRGWCSLAVSNRSGARWCQLAVSTGPGASLVPAVAVSNRSGAVGQLAVSQVGPLVPAGVSTVGCRWSGVSTGRVFGAKLACQQIGRRKDAMYSASDGGSSRHSMGQRALRGPDSEGWGRWWLSVGWVLCFVFVSRRSSSLYRTTLESE
ncbi:hypothetical protein C7M84_006687 [Penaeus vannamei]|uniref:Uncharacterized protein n=1 Tax=Penaeus vannamei TaxID=6689 RepID=A0A3R7N1K6_PENVA|nr:hypothetical protein C7M84_006687 [Penaeus vannamei]